MLCGSFLAELKAGTKRRELPLVQRFQNDLTLGFTK
jgi:hypothetical protein